MWLKATHSRVGQGTASENHCGRGNNYTIMTFLLVLLLLLFSDFRFCSFIHFTVTVYLISVISIRWNFDISIYLQPSCAPPLKAFVVGKNINFTKNVFVSISSLSPIFFIPTFKVKLYMLKNYSNEYNDRVDEGYIPIYRDLMLNVISGPLLWLEEYN